MDVQDLRLDTVHRLISNTPRMGKTKLQKLAYFLQESEGVPLGYRFKMHHYGPYAEALETDLARLRLAGQVHVTPDSSGYGFQITIDASAPDEEWRGSVAPFNAKVSQILEDFGQWPITKLELAATIHFVERLLRNATPTEVIEKTMALKPKFGEGYVISVYDELVHLGMVRPR